jgi:hypothetical protein
MIFYTIRRNVHPFYKEACGLFSKSSSAKLQSGKLITGLLFETLTASSSSERLESSAITLSLIHKI